MSQPAEPNAGGARQIASGLYLEGLAVDTVRDVVWYSDVIAGGIYGVRPDGTMVCSFNLERKWTGGVYLNEGGEVLSSGGGGIMWNHPDKGSSGWLIDSVAGVPLIGVNEMTADGHGGLYFGTCDIENVEKGEPARAGGLYHLTAAGRVTKVVEKVGFPNGIVCSPDGTRLFYNATFDGTYVCDIHADGSLGEPRKLLDKQDADGMAATADGDLLLTGYKSGELTRLRQDGTVLGTVALSPAAITQVRYGGEDMRDVYFNAVPLDAGDNLAAGTLPTEQRSFLMRGRSAFAGRAFEPTRFQLT